MGKESAITPPPTATAWHWCRAFAGDEGRKSPDDPLEEDPVQFEEPRGLGEYGHADDRIHYAHAPVRKVEIEVDLDYAQERLDLAKKHVSNAIWQRRPPKPKSRTSQADLGRCETNLRVPRGLPLHESDKGPCQ